MLYARETDATYETFEARCPVCLEWIVFNRVDDLDGESAIDYAEVACLNKNCGATFAINGDTADPPFAQMLFSAYPLMERKQYGEAVIAICRAYEMFFAHSIVELLVWRPFVVDHCQTDVDEINALAADVRNLIEKRSFGEMRNAFMNIAVRAPVTSVAQGRALVGNLPQFFKGVTDGLLETASSPKIAYNLERLLASEVNRVRNAVVHKSAERPGAAAATELFGTARDIVWDLADELEVRFEAL